MLGLRPRTFNCSLEKVKSQIWYTLYIVKLVVMVVMVDLAVMVGMVVMVVMISDIGTRLIVELVR